MRKEEKLNQARKKNLNSSNEEGIAQNPSEQMRKIIRYLAEAILGAPKRGIQRDIIIFKEIGLGTVKSISKTLEWTTERVKKIIDHRSSK